MAWDEDDDRMWLDKRLYARMDSDHLMNAILFCERKFVSAQESYLKCHQNDAFYFATVYDMFPNYKYLRNEWERRKNDG